MLNLTVNGSPELLEDDDLNLTAAILEGGPLRPLRRHHRRVRHRLGARHHRGPLVP